MIHERYMKTKKLENNPQIIKHHFCLLSFYFFFVKHFMYPNFMCLFIYNKNKFSVANLYIKAFVNDSLTQCSSSPQTSIKICKMGRKLH